MCIYVYNHLWPTDQVDYMTTSTCKVLNSTIFCKAIIAVIEMMVVDLYTYPHTMHTLICMFFSGEGNKRYIAKGLFS